MIAQILWSQLVSMLRRSTLSKAGLVAACLLAAQPGPGYAAAPTLNTIADVTLLSGSPLHIPLDGFDLDGDLLTFTATSTNPSVSTFIPEGNRSMRIVSDGFGEMVFELFEQRAPRVTRQIIELASTGQYNGVPFHRVIDNFVIQGGDITNGDGTGGSLLGDFDDQFHVDLQHNQTGILSMAKAFDDGNDSQFFITEGPSRHLDFNHSIFGQLTEGESVRQAISNVPVNGSTPINSVLMDTVEIITDHENGVLMLSAPEGFSGSTEVTVTVSDGSSSFDRTFNVNVTPDTINGGPFLADLEQPVFVTEQGVAGSFQLEAIDVEGDAVFFAQDASFLPPGTTASTDSTTGLVTITPDASFTGEFNLFVGVRALFGSNTADTWDVQRVPVLVLPDSLVADFDNDSIVDGTDFLTWQRGNEVGTTPAEGDANGDGVVDEFDLAAWQFQFGEQATGTLSTAQSVPEPSAMSIALTSLFLLTANRYFRNRLEA